MKNFNDAGAAKETGGVVFTLSLSLCLFLSYPAVYKQLLAAQASTLKHESGERTAADAGAASFGQRSL